MKRDERVRICNLVLEYFAGDTWISVSRGRIRVNWSRSDGTGLSREWQTRGGQDFYPVWHNKWGHGGTASTALSQLVRWIQDRPVLPLGTWRHWMGPKCYLGREHGPEAVEMLRDAGYPEVAICVLCHKVIDGGMDWWNLDGVSGPCCDHRSGCRQTRVAG